MQAVKCAGCFGTGEGLDVSIFSTVELDEVPCRLCEGKGYLPVFEVVEKPPEPKCKTCNDSGWYREGPLPPIWRINFSKKYPCKDCGLVPEFFSKSEEKP